MLKTRYQNIYVKTFVYYLYATAAILFLTQIFSRRDYAILAVKYAIGPFFALYLIIGLAHIGWLCWKNLLTKPANFYFLDVFFSFSDKQHEIEMKDIHHSAKPSGMIFFVNLIITLAVSLLIYCVIAIAVSMY